MRLRQIAWSGILLLILSLQLPLSVLGATPYKTYMIKDYKGWDILCDTYTVNKGDNIWEILRRRGCIAEDNFPKFIVILKHLNPRIKNVDRIYPGQEILIPLKQTKTKEKAHDGGPRYVIIPIIPDVLYDIYEVHSGDCLSEIVTAHLGIPIKYIPKEYFETLKQLNPNIKDMDLIYPGQEIRIPELALEDATDQGTRKPPQRHQAFDKEGGKVGVAVTPASGRRIQEWPGTAVSMVLKQIGGSLLQSGDYFFPTENNRDLKLDLSAFPVLELADGRRLLLETGKGLPQGAEKVIRTFWKYLSIIHIDRKAAGPDMLDKIFRSMYGEEVRQTLDISMLDEDIKLTLRGDWIFAQKENKDSPLQHHCITLISDPEECTSAALIEYLAEKNILVSDLLIEPTPTPAPNAPAREAGGEAPEPVKPTKPIVQILEAHDQKTFVAEFAGASGYTYEHRAPLSFYYDGFQIQTTADLIHGESGLDAVIDFGTFYGETKSAMEAGGLKVLSIRPEDKALTIAGNILKTTGVPFTEDPDFFGANREVFKTISITIPGLLASRTNQEKTLLTQAPLHPKICDFLMENGIKVLKIKPRY